MLSYYRTLFDITSDKDDLAGLSLMRDVEEVLRTWVYESFPEHLDILDDPGDARSGRMWESPGALLRLSGGSMGEHGYFWLRRHVDDDDGTDYRRYLGFRLATEGDSVQADIEVRVGNRTAGHFDDEIRKVMEILLSRYQCATLGTDLSQHADQVRMDQVGSFWNHISSPDRCLPIVMVSEKRSGGMPVDGDALQRDLIGLAEVACCTDDVAWTLGWYSWKLLCYDGQVRVYAPGLDIDDGELRHRSWTFEDMSSLEYHAFLQLLRDECVQRIYYPAGRDALRVFSRVRGRVREQIRAELSRENLQVYDEWAEELSAKDDDIKRWQETHRQLEVDNARLNEEVRRLKEDNWRLRGRWQSSEGRLTEGYRAPVVGGDEAQRPHLRTVNDVVEVVKEWQYVRVFEQVTKNCNWIPRDAALGFYDVLLSLNSSGKERATMLGSSEEDWMRARGIDFRGRETTTTMNQYGHRRCFQDDDGSIVEMQPHVPVRDLRVHVCWSREESCWLWDTSDSICR